MRAALTVASVTLTLPTEKGMGRGRDILGSEITSESCRIIVPAWENNPDPQLLFFAAPPLGGQHTLRHRPHSLAGTEACADT